MITLTNLITSRDFREVVFNMKIVILGSSTKKNLVQGNYIIAGSALSFLVLAQLVWSLIVLV